MKIHLEFDGPYPSVREQLNAIYQTVVGIATAEAMVTRELIHHVIVDAVDVAQEIHRINASEPPPIVAGVVDVSVTFALRPGV